MSDDDTVRLVVHFSGRVQGVGFRYTVRQIAKGFDVVGIALNLPDGRVLLDIEGKRKELDAFLTAIGNQMAGYIREVTQRDDPDLCNHRGFSIR